MGIHRTLTEHAAASLVPGDVISAPRRTGSIDWSWSDVLLVEDPPTAPLYVNVIYTVGQRVLSIRLPRSAPVRVLDANR